MGGWNKGIKGAPGGGFAGKKHSNETLSKMRGQQRTAEQKENISRSLKGKSRPSKAIEIATTENCQYGCNAVAKYQFTNGKYCCSKSSNSCPSKRKAFSDRSDHATRAIKSLQTRQEQGITKSSRKKAHETMLRNGTYNVMREKMQHYWANNHHQNNIRCPLIPYKETEILYQGSYEFKFLQQLEDKHGIDWLIDNVFRGPSIWYEDATLTKRLYISDFLIDNTVYEIKSNWTWNKHGTDIDLENNNKAKLAACISGGYNVILILEGQEIKYEQLA